MSSIYNVLYADKSNNSVSSHLKELEFSNSDIEMCMKTITICTMSKTGFSSDFVDFLKFIAMDNYTRTFSKNRDAYIDEFRDNVKQNINLYFSHNSTESKSFPDMFFDDCFIIVLYFLQKQIGKV